jgi:hypothetical protein
MMMTRKMSRADIQAMKDRIFRNALESVDRAARHKLFWPE